MKKLSVIKTIVAFTTIIFFSINQASSQTNPTLSPLDSASGVLKSGAHVKIVYSSPSVRGRKIWGDLVPYTKIWRAGANAATLIEFDKDVKVEDNLLKAGKYSIYMVPQEESSWLVYFSSQTGQPGMNHDGTSTLDMTKVLLSVFAETNKTKAFNESLKYKVNEKGFSLVWEKLEVVVHVK